MSAPAHEGNTDPQTSATPKAIGSLAKKQSDVTRQGTQKLKFTPVLPARRKKEEPRTEPTPASLPESSNGPARGRGRGRGRGGLDTSQGRGRGSGGRGAPPPVEMTASGPFAMGPALSGSQARRSAGGRSDFTPAVPTTLRPSSLGDNLTRTAAPTLKTLESLNAKGKETVKKEEEEYSDPGEGVEIIDMSRVGDMDWMAPESLQEEQKRGKVKKEEAAMIDLENALNLNHSDDEDEIEDLIEDFAIQENLEEGHAMREDRLYFFQFPEPFPNFVAGKSASTIESNTELSTAPPASEPPAKKVSFAPDTKPPLTPSSSRTSTAPPEPVLEEPVDGVIGQLEVYRSGVVKMRLANGILLDVNTASQPSFLQQGAYLDTKGKQLTVLGEVNKQFVVSPDVESLLEGMERVDKAVPMLLEGEEDLIKMDII